MSRQCREAPTTPRLREREVLGCTPGAYPWDHWERYAIDQGLDRKLASLGRAVIREAYQHSWDEHLKSLCGWNDDGQRMLEVALRRPAIAKARWTRLLDSDGGRNPEARS